MRGSLSEIRRSFGVFDENSRAITPIRAAAALGLGATLGVIGVLLAAPTGVSANDDAGVRAVVAQDARGRGVLRAEAPLQYGRPTSRFEAFFEPIVRSFSPQPRARDRAQPRPPAIAYASAPANHVQPIKIMDQTGGPRRAADATPRPKLARAEPAGQSRAASQQLGRRTVCVRTCDGYYFPIGNLNSASDLPTHEAMCQAACPDAEAKIFTIEAGSTIERAVSRQFRTYAALPAAFAYRSTRSASCTCNRNVEQTRVSLLRDPTLRPGDLVVTGERAQVFNGSSTWPRKPSDFTDFSRSRRLTVAERKKVDSMLGVTYAVELLKPYAIVKQDAAPPKAPVVAAAAPVQIIRPEARTDVARHVAQVVQVSTPRGSPQSAKTIVTAPNRASTIRVVESRSAPGFMLR